MTAIRSFFPKLRHFFPMPDKGQGRPPPPLVTRLVVDYGVFFHFRNITAGCDEIEHCKLKNVSRGEKSKKKKVKIKTQNEKIIKTDVDMWY